nr:MAG TPA: hypothetical protein [Caudoviricetes sp.]
MKLAQLKKLFASSIIPCFFILSPQLIIPKSPSKRWTS